MARLCRLFAFLVVLIACFSALATSLPLDDNHNSTGEILEIMKTSLSNPKEHATPLNRTSRGIRRLHRRGFGYGYSGFGYGGYYPCYTFLGCMLNAKRMFLGSKYFEFCFF